jgi:hypothetical protein
MVFQIRDRKMSIKLHSMVCQLMETYREKVWLGLSGRFFSVL